MRWKCAVAEDANFKNIGMLTISPPWGLKEVGGYFLRALPCAIYLAPVGLEEKKGINELTRIKD